MQAGRPSRDMVKGEGVNRIIIYRGRDGQVKWDKPHRYGDPPILHGARIIASGSMFDLLSVMRVYRNVLSPLMAGLNDDKLRRIGRINSLVTMFDGDTAGELARDRIDQALGGQGRRIRHLKLKPKQDAGCMAIDEVVVALDGLVDLDYTPPRLET